LPIRADDGEKKVVKVVVVVEAPYYIHSAEAPYYIHSAEDGFPTHHGYYH